MAEPVTIAGLATFPRITDYSMLREGDLLFCSGLDAASKIIEEATCSIWSHVAMLTLDPRDGEWHVLQAYTPNVNCPPLSWMLQNADNTGKPYNGSIAIGRWSNGTTAQFAKAIKFGLSQLEIGYGIWTDVSIAMHIILRRLPPITPSGKNWICSQLVQAAFSVAGMMIATDLNGFCDPGDCWSPDEVVPVGTLLLAA
jgi:hypothetical protein